MKAREKYFKTIFALVISLTLLFKITPVFASATVDITGKNVATIQSEITAALAVEDEVFVIGTATDMPTTLTFAVATGKTVIWSADYSSTTTINLPLITISGSGNFNVVDGATISNIGTGNALNIQGAANNLAILVDNSTIQVNSGCAIQTKGLSASVVVSGNSLVKNVSGSNMHAAIDMDGADSTILIKDNSVITNGAFSSDPAAIVSSYAIQTRGNITIESGTISTQGRNGRTINLVGTNSTAIINGGTITASGTSGTAISTATTASVNVDYSKIIINDGIISAGLVGIQITGNYTELKINGGLITSSGDGVNARVIYNNGGSNATITISGGEVSALGSGYGIYNSQAGATITVENTGRVLAKTHLAIRTVAGASTVITGGVVFAYNAGTSLVGNSANYVISHAYSSSNPAVVLAWNSTTANPPYDVNSSTDITKNVAGVNAYWGRLGSEVGIFYELDGNTGFIPVDTTLRAATLTLTAPSFTTVNEGYSPLSGQALVIENSGDQAVINSITFSPDSAFEIATAGNSTIAAGGTDNSWLIRPKTGLAEGTYSATITVDYDSKTVDTTVNFTVDRKLSSAKDIIVFKIAGQTGATIIQGTDISVTLPYGSSLDHLDPTTYISPLATVVSSSPDNDFNAPVTYTVTAEDGSTKVYTVTVTILADNGQPNTGDSVSLIACYVIIFTSILAFGFALKKRND